MANDESPGNASLFISNEEILSFWFGTFQTDGLPLASVRQRWFVSSAQWDEEIRQRFAALVESARCGELDDWMTNAHGCLSLVLLLDQFTRNIYRGRTEAFACDEQARAIVRDGLRRHFDAELRPVECSFFYMPLEHSENLADQDECVRLFELLVNRTQGSEQDFLQGSLQWARQHRDIIVRFQRFPHRNAVLSRQSTAEEMTYLADGAQRFGQ